MNSHVKPTVAAACLAGLIGLGLASTVSAADEVKKEGAQAPSVTRGKKAWTQNCARCHEMRDPKDLTDREWPAVIRHMRIRGGLTGQEERDMLELFIGR